MTKLTKLETFKVAHAATVLLKDSWTNKAKDALMMEAICEASLLDIQDKIDTLEAEVEQEK